LLLAKEAEMIYKATYEQEHLDMSDVDSYLNKTAETQDAVKAMALDIIRLSADLGTKGWLMRIRKERPYVSRILGYNDAPRLSALMLEDYKDRKPQAQGDLEDMPVVGLPVGH
jgi:hypothetical protein